MNPIAKIIGTAFYGSQETNFQLASINFDFALMKVEAPAEYRGLGNNLSEHRKGEAEDGLRHRTARKLGALFDLDLPDTPRLFQAYGSRVTEISNSPKVNPKGSEADGPFADHVGADGTTIWAAATSGKSSIAVHLLACLLARMWPQGEAISIWSEFVEQRKHFLHQKLGSSNTFRLSDVSAAQTDVTRDQLAEWDAGARAWLHTADRAKKLQQTQLRLVLENLPLPVAAESNIYNSVMEVWTKALTAMENLLLGKPQRVDSGPLLLGLSSWHLYPDMSVYGKLISQNDNLMPPGSLLTVGLQKKPDSTNDGFYWSLPLGHLRYYGQPVTTTRSMGVAQTRASFDQLLYVAFGSILSTWRITDLNFEISALIIKHLSEKVSKNDPLPWLSSLGRVCERFLKLEGAELDECHRLISFGIRRCVNFIDHPSKHPAPVFGLTYIPNLMAPLDNVPSKISFLRNWASTSKYNLDGAIIRYVVSEGESFTFLDCKTTGKKRSNANQEVFIGKADQHWTRDFSKLEEILDMPSNYLEEEDLSFPPRPGARPIPFTFLAGDRYTVAIYYPSTVMQKSRGRHNHIRYQYLHHILKTGILHARHWNLILPQCSRLLEESHSSYLASLRALEVAELTYMALPEAHVSLSLTARPINQTSFAKSVTSRYRSLGASQRNPKVNQSAQVMINAELETLKESFSCVALFTTGHVDNPPEDFGGAMAICHEDSIFVAQRLLQDPTDERPSFVVKRIAGNIGRSGLSILIPPIAPEFRKVDHKESWRVVNYKDFDGKYEDNFGGTSLHLSFTGSILPLDTGNRGDIHRDASFVETLIQVYDGGEWVADIDILKALSNFEYGWDTKVCCDDLRIKKKMVSVDNWNELLDTMPPRPLVRARGNHLARLAAATVLVQRGLQPRLIHANSQPIYAPNLVINQMSDGVVEFPRPADNIQDEDITDQIRHGSFQGDLGFDPTASSDDEDGFSSDDSSSNDQETKEKIGDWLREAAQDTLGPGVDSSDDDELAFMDATPGEVMEQSEQKNRPDATARLATRRHVVYVC